MSQTKGSHWLSSLPVCGYDITIFYKDGSVRVFNWGRLITDGQILHLNLLEAGKDEIYPTIIKTLHIHEDDIAEICFSSEEISNEIYLLKRPDYTWLQGLPKSRNCHIFVTCEQWEESKEIFKGWIEYDTERIYLREIIRSRENAETGKMTYEVTDHTRNIRDVIAIFVSINDQPVKVFVRTIAKEPEYR